MKKNRLTITLSQDILDKVDRLIDKKNIRNRSHAIEHLISQSLQPAISTAVILAGGKKDKQLQTIRPLTLINDQPLIHHTLQHLAKSGIKQVYIATNERGHGIQEFVGDGKQYNLKIEYLIEKVPLGTAGAIRNLKKKIKSTFLVWPGDVLSDINLEDMANFHFQNKSIATIATKPRATKRSYDNVFMQGHKVVSFQPSQENQQVSIVNTGVYLFEPEIFNYLKATPSMLETDVFPQLTRDGECVAFVFQGMWFDVAADTGYQQAIPAREE